MGIRLQILCLPNSEDLQLLQLLHSATHSSKALRVIKMRFVLLSLLVATLALSALSAPTAPTAGESQVAPSKEDNGVQLQDTGSLNRRQDTGKLDAMGAMLKSLTTGGAAKKSLPTGGEAKKKSGILGGLVIPGIV